jgi:hypothetical protein
MSTKDDMNRNTELGAPRLAECYIPMQMFGKTFDPQTALQYGTIFPELVRPYSPTNKPC